MEIIRGASLGRDQMAEVVGLNRQAYSGNRIGTLGDVEAVLERNPDICIAARESSCSRIIGYMSAIPLQPAAFERLLDPKREESLGLEDVIRFGPGATRERWYHLYIASIVVAPEHRRQRVFTQIYDAFLACLQEMGRARRIFFRDVAARTRPQGEKICLSLGMRFLGTAVDGENIYYSLMPPPALAEGSERGAALAALYDKAGRG